MRFTIRMLTLALTALIPLTHARIQLYGPCSVNNSHLDFDSKAFISDCDSFGFCAVNGTCLPRQCRKDEFLMTSLLNTGHPIPPMCDSGFFCPDDSSGCLPLVPVGGRCQLNRDDECQPAPLQQTTQVTNEWDDGASHTGAVCLLGTCMWSNITLGQACVYESTDYTGYDVSGMKFTTTVTKDNCIEGQGFCDIGSSTCRALGLLGEACSADRECQTYSCDTSSNACIIPPESEVHVEKWVYALVGLAIALGMGAILTALVIMHRRRQESKRIMLEDYHKEQTAYRDSILSTHSALSRVSSKDRMGMEKPLMGKMDRSASRLSEMTLVDDRRFHRTMQEVR